jgi:hypothetical protein
VASASAIPADAHGTVVYMAPYDTEDRRACVSAIRSSRSARWSRPASVWDARRPRRSFRVSRGLCDISCLSAPHVSAVALGRRAHRRPLAAHDACRRPDTLRTRPRAPSRPLPVSTHREARRGYRNCRVAPRSASGGRLAGSWCEGELRVAPTRMALSFVRPSVGEPRKTSARRAKRAPRVCGLGFVASVAEPRNT